MEKNELQQFLSVCAGVCAAVLVTLLTFYLGVFDVASRSNLGAMIAGMDLAFHTTIWLAVLLLYNQLIGFPNILVRQAIACMVALILLLVIYSIGYDAKVVMMSLPDEALTFRTTGDIRTGSDLLAHIVVLLLGLTGGFVVINFITHIYSNVVGRLKNGK